MEIFLLIMLFILWTLFWSFSSVVIHRTNSNESGIFNWRSRCDKCKTTLKALDLIPIISWIKNRWRCSTCHKKIWKIYPILEISSWILFLLIWKFLVDINLIIEWNLVEISKLIFFLFIWFISIVYIFYDILFLEIPEWILMFWVFISFIIISLQSFFPWFQIVENLWKNEIDHKIVIQAIIISFAILIWLYLIMLRWFKEYIDIIILSLSYILVFWFKKYYNIDFKDIAILNALIWAMAIFTFFFIQIVISRWLWMWWWDLRIAIFIWLILWTKLFLAWVMITYLVWSIISISIIILWKLSTRIKKMNFSSQIPFWPFLWIWLFITLFFSQEIIQTIDKYFII